MFQIVSVCKGGGYRYCRTEPPHPRANAKGLYPLHRVIVENRLGRLLEPGEVVHHRDRNKENNAEENLEVLQNADHSRYHQLVAAPAPIPVQCPCGREFTLKPSIYRRRMKRNRSGARFCSKRCVGAWSGRGLQKRQAQEG